MKYDPDLMPRLLKPGEEGHVAAPPDSGGDALFQDPNAVGDKCPGCTKSLLFANMTATPRGDGSLDCVCPYCGCAIRENRFGYLFPAES